MKQFVVIGLGRFGSNVAKALYSMDHEVLAIDKDEEKVQDISDYVTHAVQADATDENVLKSLGIRNFDVVVVTTSSDIHSSILITLLCKEIGVKFVIAKAQSELHAKVLYKIGADKVVFPERDMAMRVVHNLVSSNILDYIEVTPEYSLVEIETLSHWVGHSLKELNIRGKYGISVLAIKHGKEIIVAPNGDDIINKDDILVVIGKTKDITRLENKYQT
ncbi:MAG: TrkA family potassium uptake protein [Clostridiales bacterium]|nr:TrkA family potassium uptake protein [Clostridiales bacterium]